MKMRLPRVPLRRSVAKLEPYVAPVEGRAGKLRLDFNENTGGCSSSVLRALRSLTPEQIAIYPEYEATTARLARFFKVRPNEMLLTNGVDDALHVLMDTFIEPGSTVLIVEPTFNMYRFYAQLAGARIHGLRYEIEMRHKADIRFPQERILQALKRKPRALLLANPNNPTGTLVTQRQIRSLLRAAPRTLVLVDEAYFEFSGVSVLSWIREYPNLVVSRTFSKTAALAGLRLGCLFAAKEMIAVLKRADSPYPVNTAALVAAEAVIRDPKAMREYADGIVRNRAPLMNSLENIGARVYPSDANFLLVDFGEDTTRMLRRLESQGILLRDRSSEFGRKGFVRITVGTAAQNDRLVRAMHVYKDSR
ncbi:MAG: histidinol-phosphate transaminase [Candidatus Acidiferrales bacterium]